MNNNRLPASPAGPAMEPALPVPPPPLAGERWDRRWWLAAAGLVLAYLVVVAPLVTGKLTPIHDADGFSVPYYTLLADFLREGKLVLWNPWSNGGTPEHMEPQVGALAPHFLLTALLTGGGEPGYRVHWLACWAVGLLGMLALGRRLGVHPAVAAAVALAFAMSGPFIGHAQCLSIVWTFALLPVALCRLDAALEEGNWLAAVQAGALWGLSGFGGYPGVLMITGALLFLWAAARLLFGRAGAVSAWGPPRPLSWRQGALLLACCFGVGLLVLLAPVLPILLDGKGFTDRAGALPRELVVASNALHPRALVTIFSPYLATLPPPRVWPYTDLSSCSLYLGVVPLLLAVHALYARPRSGLRWWLLGLGLLFLAIAIGRALPVRGWLYDLVLPTRYVRHASISRLGTVFCFTVLACLGARDLLRERGVGLSRWAPLVTAVALAVAAVVTYGAMTDLVSTPTRSAGDRHLWIAWPALVILAAAAGLLAGRARRLTLLVGLPLLAFYDAAATFQLANSVGSATLVEPWRQLGARHVASLSLLPDGLARLPVSNDSTGFGPGPTNKNLVPRIPAFMGHHGLSNELHLRWGRTPALARLVLVPERIYFSPVITEVEPSAEAFAAFAGRVTSGGGMPLLVHRRATMAGVNGKQPLPAALAGQVGAAPAATAIKVRWQSYLPDRLQLEVEAPQDGWLLVTDRWARAWRATVDGKPTPVEGGNFLFRALPLARGKHTVQMSYHPTALVPLLAVSWGTLLAVLAATLWLRWGRRRRPVAAATQ
jgi:hypothetical protein